MPYRSTQLIPTAYGKRTMWVQFRAVFTTIIIA